MLLWALQGHRYERYDARGRVEERATIDVGPLEVDGDRVSAPLDVEVYQHILTREDGSYSALRRLR